MEYAEPQQSAVNDYKRYFFIKRRSTQNNGQECQIVIFRELTTERKLEQQMEKYKTCQNLYRIMAREMISPLGTIQTFTNQMYEYGRTNENENINENFEKYRQLIINSSKYIEIRMRDIYDQTLLQDNCLKADNYEFSPIEAVNEIKLIMMSQLQSFRVEIISEFEQSVKMNLFGDFRRLQQVLFNLLNYTSKLSSTKKKRIIKINTELWTINDLDFLQVNIEDKGIILNEEQI